jgi:hypothetical protein
VEVEIQRAYTKVERTKSMVQVATQPLRLRQEGEGLVTNCLTHGVALRSEQSQAAPMRYKM